MLVGAFLPPLDFFIINVALPSIRAGLGASSSAEQLVISSYAGLYAVTLITGGRLGDLFGRGRMFFLGLIGFATASLLCGLASSPWTLIVGRALQGVTAAIMAPQALASIQAIFPEAEKPLALSLYGAVFGLAAVVGQALGGILISLNLLNLGWRAIFLVNLPVAILVVLFGVPLLRETRAQHARKLDLGGTALSMLTLGALIVPLIEGREAGWPAWAWASLIAVPVLAGFFWRYERRLGNRGGAPLLDPAALRAPGLGRALLIALLLYAIGAFFLLFSVYLQNALHVDALSAGLVFLPFGLGFLLGPLSTPFCTRLIGAYVNPFGMGLEVVGLVGLAWLIDATPIGMQLASMPLAAALFVIGFGQGARAAHADAHGDRTRCTGAFRHDRRHCQLDAAGQHVTQRRDHRRNFLYGPRHASGSGRHCARVHRRASLDFVVPRRRRRAGHLARTCTRRADLGARGRPAELRP
ncbi:MFS transporter [Dyella jiangningensis]